MRPHPRTRKMVKWGGLAVSVLLTTAIAASTVWLFHCHRLTMRGQRDAMLTGGGLVYQWENSYVAGLDPRRTAEWRVTRRQQSYLAWWPRWNYLPYGKSIFIPLWIPTLASLAASTLAWRLDILARRREKLGTCPSCGYDRSGIAPSSPCPECGKECAATVPPPAAG